MEEGSVYILPAPTGGINRRDNITDMPETDALDLINWIPDANNVRLRRGTRIACTGCGTGSVPTVAEFAAPDGTRKRIAAGSGKLWDATGSTGVQLGTGYSSDRWNVTQYSDALLLYNGANIPKKITAPAGVTTLADLTYTAASGHTGLTATKLIQPAAFKDVLYFLHEDSSDVWYGVVGELEGELKKLPLGRVFTKGGYALFAGAWTLNANSDTDEVFVVVSDQGEVVQYQGTNPDDVWEKTGHFFIAPPFGRRSFVRSGPDLVVLTSQGVVPLIDMMSSGGGANFTKITDKVQLLFSELSKLYGTNDGWDGLIYQEGHLFFINIPMSSARSDQLVMNTLTGAWTRFKGWNMASLCEYNKGLYFGGLSGGVIFQGDYGGNDNGKAIETYSRQAYSYFKKPLNNKQLIMAMPHVSATANVQMALGCDVDFANKDLTENVVISGVGGEAWDVAEWDAADWESQNIATADWLGVEGFGRAIALKYKANFINCEVALSATNVLYQLGGIF